MIKALQKIIEDALRRGEDDASGADREHAVKVATAALLIEVARADFRENVVESEAVFHALKTEFELAPKEAESLMRLAEEEADNAVSLHGFTRLLNDQLDETEKSRVIGMLWKISVADGWRTGPAIDRGGRWNPADVGDAVREILAKAVPPQKVYGT